MPPVHRMVDAMENGSINDTSRSHGGTQALDSDIDLTALGALS